MDDIKTKDDAIKLIKKLRDDYDWNHFRKMPALFNRRIADLITKFNLSSKDIS